MLEDNTRDAELIQELLEADHFVFEVTRVQTRAEFVAGLENAGIDLILADYKLPSFDGLSALKLALDARADLPFIFVSGSLGEEVAIEAVKIGATDYVVKSRLSRLVPCVQRALREAQEVGDVLGAYRVLQAAFETDVRPLLAEFRKRQGRDPDPIAAFRASGYAGRVASEQVAPALKTGPSAARPRLGRQAAITI